MSIVFFFILNCHPPFIYLIFFSLLYLPYTRHYLLLIYRICTCIFRSIIAISCSWVGIPSRGSVQQPFTSRSRLRGGKADARRPVCVSFLPDLIVFFSSFHCFPYFFFFLLVCGSPSSSSFFCFCFSLDFFLTSFLFQFIFL